MKANIITWLKTYSTITDLVVARIYSAPAPRNASKPFITIQMITDESDRYLGGVNGYARGTYDIDCYAATPEGAHALANAVRAATDGYSGAMGTATDCYCHIRPVIEEPPEPEDTGGDDMASRIVLSASIGHNQ